MEVNYTNGRHTEETSEEEEEMNREHMANVEGETEIHKMKKRKKTRKLHEVILTATGTFNSSVICSANFPHLQPMAELWRNQRAEIGRQHVMVHSCSHFSPCF